MISLNTPEYPLAHESATYPQTPRPPEDGRTPAPAAPVDVGWELVKPAPCFSFATFLSAVDNDRDFAVELLELLVAQTPAEVQAIGQALERNDFATIGQVIHSQKVSFQVIGLTEVVRIGQAAEVLIRASKAGTEVALLITRYSQALNAELSLIRTSLQSVP